MPISCSAIALAAGGAAYEGLSEHDNTKAQTYLLASIAGVATDAETIIALAEVAGWAKLPERNLQEAIAYLLCQVATGLYMNSHLAASGVSTLSGGAVTVNSISASATNIILLTYYSLDGNQATVSYSNIVEGISFDINSSNSSDTNEVSWVIFKP
jgi:hypothetical protein